MNNEKDVSMVEVAFNRAKKGDISILEDYNDNILSTHYGNDKSTCIHELAKMGKTDILGLRGSREKLLLTKDIQDRTPLHWLAMGKVSNGLIPMFNTKSLFMQDEEGKTPLHYLAEHFDVSSCDKKALSIRDYEDGNTPVHEMVESGVKFNIDKIPENILLIKNILGETVAHLLAYQKNKEFFKCSKALNVKNLSNKTPVDIYEAKSSVVTAKFKPWRRVKVIIVPEKYIEIEGIRFDWDENGGKRIYTYTYDDKDTLSFCLYKENSEGVRIGISALELPYNSDLSKIYAFVSGRDTLLKTKLLYWLEDNNVIVNK